MSETLSSRLSAYRGDWSFAELLDWHLRRGTRPGGSDDPTAQGDRWTNVNFAACLSSTNAEKRRSVEGWRRAEYVPTDIDPIEKALFGEDGRDAFNLWRGHLRDAYFNAKRGTAVRPPKRGAGPDESAVPTSPTENQSSDAASPANAAGADTNQVEATKWYRTAAEKGELHAQFMLSWRLFSGLGADTNLVEAAMWCRQAAERGYAPAERFFGWLTFSGFGVEKNYVEAVKWYRKAAEQGDDQGQDALGWMLINGQGVEKTEPEEGARWFRKAAEQGLASAQNALAWVLFNGIGVEQNHPEAAMWCRKSAEQNFDQAQKFYGWMLENGIGVERNAAEAIKWYRKAAEQGNGEAQIALAGILAKGAEE